MSSPNRAITMKPSRLLFAVLAWSATLTAHSMRADESSTVLFHRDIRPILSDKCFTCHGPDAESREANLRLDSRESTLSDRGDHAVVVPGHPDQSELWKRIRSDDPDQRMPPEDAGPKLTKNEADLIRRWIKQGAAWSEHWSYVAPKRPPLPLPLPRSRSRPNTQDDWAKNSIDAFVQAKMRDAGLHPSPEADPHTLIRRLSLDLTGLPPTLNEIEQFKNESIRPGAPGQSAICNLVDRLLASPHFGHRWARPWLDLARYADSNGFQADQLRSSWPYRDWVIDALNSNMPFDQFTTEQLAGDLLPAASIDQRVATGFHRSVTCNVEAGVDPEANRVDQVVDRVNTTSTVWLGTTLECAQCHDHKYDPFSMQDYYQLFAYFNHTPLEVRNEDGKGVQFDFYGPTMKLPSPSQPKGKNDRATTLVMVEMDKRRPSHILLRGNYRTKGEAVSAGAPTRLHPVERGSPTNRLGLAEWLVDPNNPLTARVVVNRWWAELFGRGIVTTLEDFGSQGAPPTHPQLLDWLAV
ncbi:MAG TPA: DUF1549 domain-containing protein, partial [Pirellulales bacterium]|nr:DUF1549 domain-containing protein [Pirellulales bacterium]